MRRGVRVSLAAALAAAGACATAPAAQAVGVDVSQSGGTVTITGTSFAEDLVVEQTGTGAFAVVRTDAGLLNAGANCDQATLVLVKCGPTPVTQVDASLGSGDDSLAQTGTMDTLAGITVNGGDDNDTLSSERIAATLNGGNGNDSLTGSTQSDALNGGNDTDTLNGAGGDDTLHGNAGTDSLTGGFGIDLLFGDAGADTIAGDAEDTMDGGSEGDTFTGQGTVTYAGRALPVTVTTGAGTGDDGSSFDGASGSRDTVNADHVIGTSHDDTLTAGSSDTVDGADGADTLNGGASSQTLIGGNGDDVFTDAGGGSSMAGDAGDDTMTGGSGSDAILGGADNDTIDAGGQNDLSVDGGPGDDAIAGGGGNDILKGGAGADVLHGGTEDDTLRGEAGPDQVFGDGGADTATYSERQSFEAVVVKLDTGAGSDQDGGGPDLLAGIKDFVDPSTENVEGGAGGDTITGDGGPNVLKGNAQFDHLNGLGGADTLDAGPAGGTLDGGPGADTLAGTAQLGVDIASYATRAASEPVEVDLADALGTDGAPGENDTLAATIDGVEGGAGDDRIVLANQNGGSAVGNGGSDTLIGSPAIDLLKGGDGNDTITPGAGADQVVGEAGTDTVSYADAPGPVALDFSGPGADGPVAEPDTFVGTVERAVGGAFADTLTADATTLSLDGAGGNDTITGGALPNDLLGGGGDDELEARGGAADTLACGTGTDGFFADSGTDTVAADCETDHAAPGGGGGGGTGGGGTGGGGTGGGGTVTTRRAPVLSALSLSRRQFTVGRAATAISAARTRAGTTIRFRLSEAARVTLAVDRLAAGRRSGRRCVALRRALARAKRCVRTARAGALTRAAAAGASAVPFSGRIGRRALAPGRYRLTASAVDADGDRARAVSATFTVRAS